MESRKRYDFYISSLNCIIETHGIQHYNEPGFNAYGESSRTSKEEQENDMIKRELALMHEIDEIKYIEIDSRCSTLEYMKNSIICNYKLNNLLNVCSVNYSECNNSALRSIMNDICNLFNDGYKNNEIGNILKISRHTVGKYLKKASNIGWIEYNPSASKFSPVVQIDIHGNYIREYASISEASKITNFNSGSIGNTCAGRNKTSGGFKWMYKEDYDEYIKQESKLVNA